MAESTHKFMSRLLSLIADVAGKQAAISMQTMKVSRTLIRSMRYIQLSAVWPRFLGALWIPQYWALYVHDGRRAPVHPVNGTFLVWFRNPKRDPRLPGGVTPERAYQLKRLSAAEFKHWLEQNRIARAAGRPVPMIVVRRVNKSTPPKPFFSNGPGGGMPGSKLLAEAGVVARAEFSAHVKDVMGDWMNETDKAVVKL